ncbi:NADH-dependent flavin oxidoreductase [Weissella coleopterorum]|uniref:oxidoreductase n=1 Tax=Weissella coleopterorum TaxID=2714949 RepID=UPI001FE7960A|nr:NADH-dependent flavin oxidoreductase [Weissella coleopterorum]
MEYKFLDSIKLKHGAYLRNRIAMAPTTLDSSFYDGHISKDEVEYYAIRSGGPGMVIVETAYINDTAKGFPGQISIANDSLITGLSQIASSIKNGGAKVVIQLHHAGRLSNHMLLNDNQPVAPSSITDPSGGELPRELKYEEIEKIIDDYGKSVKRAISAGFDGVEIQGANRFLPHQFFSRQSNQREDKWGDKYNFIIDLLKKISNVVEKYAPNDFIVGYRISPEESFFGGYHYFDAIELVNVITKESCLDYIHLSQLDAVGTPFIDKDIKTPLVTLFR